MKLLGGGWRQWTLPLILAVAFILLPVGVWVFYTRKDLPPSVMLMAVLFGEFIGSVAGLLTISPAWLNTKKPWNRNSIVAVSGLIAGILMLLGYSM